MTNTLETKQTNQELYNRAVKVLPGGVNSPVRAFNAVGGTPRFMVRGEGPWLFDEEDNRYLDCYNSWGPMILGYSHPKVVAALQAQVLVGTSFGAPTKLEIEMAELIVQQVPSVEVVRMVNSGTEATMSAIRLARAYTGRDLIIKFEGCYHGHGDAFLSKAGSGAATLGQPTSPGVPKATAQATLNAQYNDLESVEELLEIHQGNIAGMIVEPVVGNMGCVPPNPGFLEGLRTLCTREGALLIFDEVMTGFRLGLSGAQGLYDVLPDITTLGKVIGGGLPVGAYGASRQIMNQVSPVGPMYQAGTLSGNPLGMAAGIATLKHLIENPEIYSILDERTKKLQHSVDEHIAKNNYPVTTNRVGSMFTIFFNPVKVETWAHSSKNNCEQFSVFFHAMLKQGVHLPPAQFEAWFMSVATTPELFEELAAKVNIGLDQVFTQAH